MPLLLLQLAPSRSSSASLHLFPQTFYSFSRRRRRRFQTLASSPPLAFKFKINIKDLDENPPQAPLDVKPMEPTVPAMEIKQEERPTQRSDLYRRNLKLRIDKVDPATRAMTMKGWPRVSTTLRSLKDADVPLGIKFNVVYHDTHAYDRHSGPVVLFVHGFQLPVVNFKTMIEPLIAQGCRVIAPLFPYIGHNIFKANQQQVTTSKEMPLVSHSTIERRIFICDFIKSILPSSQLVDVVVACDIGAFPAISLCAQDSQYFKSVVLLDPFPSAPKLLPCMQPALLFTVMSKAWELPFWRWTSLPFMAAVVMRRFGSSSFKEASAHARHVAFADLEGVGGCVTSLAMKEFPVVVYASNKNKFVSAEAAREFMMRLGIDERFVVDDIDGDDAGDSVMAAAAAESVDGVFQRTLTDSGGRFYQPNKVDDFALYNRRYAKADFVHLAGPIARDIGQLIKRVNASE